MTTQPPDDATIVAHQLNALVTRSSRDLVLRPTTTAEASTAASQFKQLKELEKRIKDEQDKITKPLNEALKNARALFAPFFDRTATLIASVRKGLGEYDAGVQAALDKQRAKLERKVQAGTITEDDAKVAVTRAAVAKGAGVVPTTTHRVVVITKPEVVPDRYWVLDEVLIRKEALAGRKIPGVEVREEKLVVNR